MNRPARRPLPPGWPPKLVTRAEAAARRKERRAKKLPNYVETALRRLQRQELAVAAGYTVESATCLMQTCYAVD